MSTKNLLVELFVEELPPKALKKLGEAFSSAIFDSLERSDFLDPASVATSYASPRRLAVHISRVRAISVPRPRPPKVLMPEAIGIDSNGKPTAPLLKRLHAMYSSDVDIEWLLRERIVVEEEGGKRVLKHLEGLAAGAPLNSGLQSAIHDAIDSLPIPKVMSYQLADGWTSVNFVRPAHGLVALHGAEVVPVQALGLKAGRETHGHRFEAAMDPVVLQDADHYDRQMQDQGAVIPGFADRRNEIVRQLHAAAAAAGLRPIEDEALLDEVAALVERPHVLTCHFEEAFLDVPQECLILTMKANQKYFPLLDARGRLTNTFLVVSNIRPEDPSAVIQGNERVVRPRLADAKFFFDQDRKRTLESRVPGLAKVVYHGKLGTQGERMERVRAITHLIVKQLCQAVTPWTAQAHDEMEMLGHKADQAARLAKTDLLTDMVGEFPELQGVMGGYYARAEGLRDGVAIAIEDHYKPRFAGDELPRNHTGTVVALADKLETLVGLFGIGQLPTGDKDPFALRRHALGVIRLLVEKHLALDLKGLLAEVVPVFGGLITDPSPALLDFLQDRLAVSLREQGYSAQEVDAVLALRPRRLDEVPRRLAAVRAFAALPEAAALAAANKRVGNILKKVEAPVEARVDTRLLKEPAEAALHQALSTAQPASEAAFAAGDYAGSLKGLAVLRGPVDAFFEAVMVNADDAELRRNRLGLLASLHAAMNRVADLSRLAA